MKQSVKLLTAFTLMLLNFSALSQWNSPEFSKISAEDSILFKQAKKLISSEEFYEAKEVFLKSDNPLHIFPLFVKHLYAEEAFKEVCDVYEYSKNTVFNQSYFIEHIISEYKKSGIKYDLTDGEFYFTLLETEPKLDLLNTLEQTGISYYNDGFSTEGLELFLDIIELSPGNHANISLLQVIESMDRKQQIKWLERAYKAGSGSDTIIDRLASLYQQSNDIDNICKRWECLLLPLADNYRMTSHYIDFLLTHDSLDKAASLLEVKMPSLFFEPFDEFYLSQLKSSTLKGKYLKTKAYFKNGNNDFNDKLNNTDNSKPQDDDQLQNKYLSSKRQSTDDLRKKIIRKINPGLLSSERSNTTIKSLVNLFENLIFIEGGDYIYESPDIAYLDEHLNPLNYTEPKYIIDRARKVMVDDFYLHQTEITNKQYREYTEWVKDSIIRIALSKKFDGQITKSEKTGKYFVNNNIEINIKDDSIKEYLEKQNIFLPLNKRFFEMISYNNDILTYKGIQVYPDTMCWLRQYPYLYNSSLSRTYNWHPAHNDYPVVGVSQLQAKTYCNWLTYRANQLLRKEGMPDSISVKFRLPTKNEWKHSFISGIGGKDFFQDTLSSNKFESAPYLLAYPEDKSALYTYNFGEIDYSGLKKRFASDGASMTAIVAHYRPLPYKNLYDLRGNVAEWTTNVVDPVNGLLSSIIYSKTNSNSEIPSISYEELKKVFSKPQLKKMIDLFPETNQFLAYLDYLNNYPPILPATWINEVEYRRPVAYGNKANHNLSKYESILISLRNYSVQHTNNNAHIVKGGSWADSPKYMVHWVDEIQPAEKQSPRIGFRVALDITDND